MTKYLDKFASKVPVVQGRQIVGMLQDLKDLGIIKNVKEYNQKLQELTEVLQSTNPQPMFKFFRAIVGDVISSDKYNAMTKAVKRDLETVFQEAQTISEVMDLHQDLFKLSILKSLRKAVSKLSQRISLYEFISKSTLGFTSGVYNTFIDVDGLALSRSDSAAPLLYVDPKTKLRVSSEFDCEVDLVGEKLLMPAISSKEYDVADISLIEDNDTVSSEKNVLMPGSYIWNIIDKTQRTYWLYPILRTSPVSGGAKIKLKLDMGGKRDINTLQIQLANPFPTVLESLVYIADDGSEESTTLNENIDGETTIQFDTISTQYLILTFRQDSYERALYTHELGRNLWEKVNDATTNDTSYGQDDDRVDRIEVEISEEVQNDNLRDILSVDNTRTFEQSAYYQYTFGFDNIRVFLSKYNNKGIYVSKKFKVSKPGLIGLYVTQSSPELDLGYTTDYEHSFEYYIVKRDFDENGVFIDQETVPILPIGAGNSISHERLVLNERSGSPFYNVGTMRIPPNIYGNTPAVFSNRYRRLTIGTDFYVKVGTNDWRNNWSSVRTDIEADSLTETPPLEVKISIVDPSPFTIYTTSYNAAIRNADPTAAAFRKLSESIRMTELGVLMCDKDKDKEVDHSDLYLVAIIRNNWNSANNTGSILDYKLLVNSYNTEKFIGD